MTDKSIKIQISKCEADPYFKCGPVSNSPDSGLNICPSNRYCNPTNWGCQGVPTTSVYRECTNDMDRNCVTPINKEKTLGRF